MELNYLELRRLRKKRNWSLEKVSRMVGVHRQTIYQYEKGLIDPSLEVFVAICRVFEVMPEQLLDVMDLSGSDIKRFKARCEEEGLSTYEAIRLFIQTY